jgi:hypothetical protein
VPDIEVVSVEIGSTGTALEMLVDVERLVEETLLWLVWAWPISGAPSFDGRS